MTDVKALLDIEKTVFQQAYFFGDRITNSPFAAQIFGNSSIENCENNSAIAEHMAKIGEKNHRHRTNKIITPNLWSAYKTSMLSYQQLL
ncbi:4640_t:CDS:2 [Funneliformis mosseae]|uniref:4640_t:CDS:1 n=1 Tax=Funneliformis mosseae TaxID=27381 RepID=A0A9N9DSU8_FUNMO|nr:4640_t:CDS:2 [Funneliformis mosseae]